MAKPRRAKNAHSSDRFYSPRQLDDRDERRQALLDKARLGSRDALGDLFTEHQPMMHTLIKAHLPNELAAKALDDLTQDAFLKALAGFAEFVGAHVAQFTDWLMKICGNVLADFLRKHQRAGAREIMLDELELEQAARHAYGRRPFSPDEVVLALETAGQLQAALNRLPAEACRIVIWRANDRLTFREIARRLQRSNDFIERAFRRAIDRLRQWLATAACPS
jgi:RNA polymerase sigma-70 factor (ECF subfamily)